MHRDECRFPGTTTYGAARVPAVLYTDGLTGPKRDKLNAEDSFARVLESVAGLDDVAILTVRPAARPSLELDITLPAQPNNGRIFRQALHRFISQPD